ncbi:hypothetical protein ACFODL_15580 [Phenylobacterium terrae]|uniref:Tip attachment protein J domain-containing protein n=1 Tax=Phenylobacterium terrae TaxID=2665495 RepID=A0ABW4N6M7_9CAUL
MEAVVAVAAWVGNALMTVGVSATVAAGTANAIVAVGAAVTSWSGIMALGSLAVSMSQKVPRPESTGVQLEAKIDPTAPVPIAFGRTATAGYVYYQAAYDGGGGEPNAWYLLGNVLSAGGPIEGYESFTADDYPLTFNIGGNTVDQAAQTPGVGGGSKLFIQPHLALLQRPGSTPETQDPLTRAGHQALAEPWKSGTAGFSITDFRLSGLAHTMLYHSFNEEAFPQGPPKPLWVIKGIKCYDPRLDSTYPGGSGSCRVADPSTYVYSENPYIHALAWVLGRYAGPSNTAKVFGMFAPWDLVDVPAFVAGANLADLNEWKCGGVVTTDDNPYSVLTTLLSCGGGTPMSLGARLSCIVDDYKVATDLITEADITGAMRVTNSTAFRERKNTVRPLYREPSQKWEMIQGETVTATVYVDEDNGETKSVEVSYPFVSSAKQAHQLATYEMLKSREFLTFEITGGLRLLTDRVGDAVTLHIPEIGADNQLCTIVERSFDAQSFQVRLVLRADMGQAKHDFALGRTNVAPPSPSLEGSYDPSNPGGPAHANDWSAVGTYTEKDGLRQPVILVRGGMDEIDRVNNKTIIVEFREYGDGDDEWIHHAESPKDETAFNIFGVKPQTAYEVSIRYRNNHDVLGERLILAVVTTGDFQVPSTNVDHLGTLLNLLLAQLQQDLIDLNDDLEQLNNDLANIDTGIPGHASEPSPSGFAEGDFYYNTTEKKLYRLEGGVWVKLNTGIPYFASAPATTGYAEGDFYFNTTDGKLYRLTSGAWVALQTGVPGFSAAPATTGYKEGDTYYNTTDGKLYRLTGGVWKAVEAGIDTRSSAPTSGMVEGDLYYNTTDKKLYRYNGTAWTAAVPAADISGTLTDAQIAAVAASKVTGQLTNAQIEAIAAAKLTGQITSTQITDGAISTPKLAAGSVTTEKLVANAVTANELAANSVTSAEIAAGAVIAGKLAANAVQAGNVAAGAIVAGSLAANSVTSVELAANSVTANEILAGAINAGHLSANAVTANAVAANAITGGKIAANQITGTHIQASTITGNNIVGGTITGAKIAGSTITGDLIAGNSIAAGHIQSNSISSEKIQSEAILASHIGAGQITSNKIGAGQIIANHIGAGQIVSNLIAADTIVANNIRGHAITRVTVTSQGYFSAIGGQTNVCNCGHTTEVGGATHLITVDANLSNQNGLNGCVIDVYRNGSHIGQRAILLEQSFSFSGSFVFFDNPPAGTNTYQVYAARSGGSSGNFTYQATYMTVTEFKR